MVENRFTRETVAPGVSFSCVTDGRFRHNGLSVNFVTPLSQREAAANAIVPFVLRQGSARCPDMTRLERRLCDLYGADLDADVSACGEYQVLSVSASGVDDRFALEGEPLAERLAQLLCEIALEPNVQGDGFDPQVFEVERRNLCDLIASEINEKRGYAIKKCRETMFAGTPLAVSRFGGAREASELTPQAALAAYRRMLAHAQVEITFVGCGDASRAKKIFADAFARVSRDPRPYTPAPLRTACESVRERTETMEVSQSKLVMGFLAGDLSTAPRRYALRLMSLMLGGTPFCKLFLNVREKRSLCYYCVSAADVMSGAMTVDCGVDLAKVPEARAAILEQLAAVASGDFTDEELDKTKLYCADAIRAVGDSIGRLETWYLSRILTGDIASPQQETDRLCAVTRQEIREAAAAVSLDTVYLLTGMEEKK